MMTQMLMGARGPSAPTVPVVVMAGSYEAWDYNDSSPYLEIEFNGTTGMCGIFDAYEEGSSNISPYSWILSGSPSDYDMRITKVGGNTDLSIWSGVSKSNNTWFRMNAGVTLGISRGTIGTSVCNANIAVRYNSNSTIIASNISSLSVTAY